MSSVVIRSADREAVEKTVTEYTKRLRKDYPEVREIVWFGSWVTGIPLPGSDVDLCLLVSSSPLRRHERATRYLPERFPVGIDLFVYTEDEFRRLKEENPAWYNEITSGRRV